MHPIPPPPARDPATARGFLLRQAGIDPRALDRLRFSGAPALALIDGPVDTRHPALRGACIERLGPTSAAISTTISASTGGRTSTTTDEDIPAVRHATFCASMLVGGDATPGTGAIGLCRGATLINYAAVTPSMLDGTQPLAEVAADLAGCVRHALRRGCRTLLLGVEIRSPRSAAWHGLRDAIARARAVGALVVIPAGNRPGTWSDAPCTWEAPLLVASLGPGGGPSAFSAAAGPGALAVFAPGEQVPGAVEDDGIGLRSGTSFAAALVAGVLGIAEALLPGQPAHHRVARLFPRPHRRLDAGMLFAALIPSAFRETAHASANR